MKKIFALLLFITPFCSNLHAQEQLSKQQQADRMFERGEYAKCLPLYLDLASGRNALVTIVERVADCYRLSNDYRNAEEWYRNAKAYTAANVTDTYYYAEALLANNKPADARQQYLIYYTNAADMATMALKLATCDSAMKWMAGKSGYEVKAAAQFNTTAADWGLNFYGDKGLVFTSDRSAGSSGTYDRTGAGYLQLYRMVGNTPSLWAIDTKNNKLFNGGYHVGPIAVNKTGDTAYITVTTTLAKTMLPVKRGNITKQRLYDRRLQLMIATLKDNVWGNIASFAYNDVKSFSVGHAALSNDGQTIYLTSDMPGGMGGTDIWFCRRQADGRWGKPVNCGAHINTKGDEAFPVINTGMLYYSSDGLPGMGGLDIFRAAGSGNAWSSPVNLRYPANSTRDDFYYVTRDNLTGYLSSNRDDGRSDDIYAFKFTPTPPAVTTNTTVNTEPGVVLSIIYYDLDKAVIRPDAVVQLDKLVALLKQRTELKIRLASYTDSRATKDYNVGLAERRSASAKAYLVAHGITPERLQTASFGENSLVNQCGDDIVCTEAQHQLNRRTEISIIK